MRFLILTLMLLTSLPVMAQTQGFEVRVTIVNPQQVATSGPHKNVQRVVTSNENSVRIDY